MAYINPIFLSSQQVSSNLKDMVTGGKAIDCFEHLGVFNVPAACTRKPLHLALSVKLTRERIKI